jgi:hypothetical protein
MGVEESINRYRFSWSNPVCQRSVTEDSFLYFKTRQGGDISLIILNTKLGQSFSLSFSSQFSTVDLTMDVEGSEVTPIQFYTRDSESVFINLSNKI